MSDTANPTAPALAKSDQNLVWLDCEMSGLNPETERLLEIAVVVTSADLTLRVVGRNENGIIVRGGKVLATSPDLTVRVEGPVLVIHQSDAVLDAMDAWNKGTHGRSGLIDKVRASTITEADAERELLAFLSRYVPKGVVPMCGNSIGQDRRFLVKYMPKLEAFFHYRNVDVSTLKELAKRWKPEAYSSFKKAQRHTALADVHESIDELLHYRTHLLAV